MFLEMMEPIIKKLDLIEICVNWIGGQDWDWSSKTNMAYQVMSRRNTENFSIQQTTKLCCWLELDPIRKSKSKLIRSFLPKQNTLSNYQFEVFMNSYHPKIFDPDFLKNKGSKFN